LAAGWLAALLGCVHYDLGEREQAEAARQAAQQFATESGHGEVLGWAQEMSAWFALVEGRYEQAIAASEAGLAVAGSTSAGVQLALQAAKAYARIGDRVQAADALNRGAAVLGRLPRPEHSEHHFIFDHAKWSLYAAGVSVLIEDDSSAEEHAREVLARHLRSDGSSYSPMRVADARIDLAIVHTRRGDLDAAVEEGLRALEPERRSLADLLNRGRDLMSIIQLRHPGDPRANALDERLREARETLQSADRGYVDEGAGTPGQEK
jgi:tetratricopeptide (TPR) repeat protein